MYWSENITWFWHLCSSIRSIILLPGITWSWDLFCAKLCFNQVEKLATIFLKLLKLETYPNGSRKAGRKTLRVSMTIRTYPNQSAAWFAMPTCVSIRVQTSWGLNDPYSVFLWLRPCFPQRHIRPPSAIPHLPWQSLSTASSPDWSTGMWLPWCLSIRTIIYCWSGNVMVFSEKMYQFLNLMGKQLSGKTRNQNGVD